MQFQLTRANSGLGWYNEDMGRYGKAWEQLDPTLADTSRQSIRTAVQAMHSLGNNSPISVNNALINWDHYMENGKFSLTNPETGTNFGAGRYNTETILKPGLKRLNQLLEEKGGEQGAADWLNSEHPIKELKQYRNSIPVGDRKTGMGYEILGDKAGDFYANMSGVGAHELTADMWNMRTWHRWMNSTMPEGSAEIVDAMKQAPNGAERAVMEEAYKQLAKKFGIDVRDAQAVQWNYEQELYKSHGVGDVQKSYGQAAEEAVSSRLGKRNASAIGESQGAGKNANQARPGAGDQGSSSEVSPITGARFSTPSQLFKQATQ